MSIGERITELRKLQNLSQGQLAQAMDVSRQAVSKWENDQTSPDSLKMIRLAEVLVVEKVVEKPVEKTVVQYVEKPVIKKVFRVKYRRNPAELAIVGVVCFLLGLLVGYFL